MRSDHKSDCDSNVLTRSDKKSNEKIDLKIGDFFDSAVIVYIVDWSEKTTIPIDKTNSD